MQAGCQNGETKKHGQMKEQIKTLEKDLNEMEISSLSDTEFKTLFIGYSRNLGPE